MAHSDVRLEGVLKYDRQSTATATMLVIRDVASATATQDSMNDDKQPEINLRQIEARGPSRGQ